MFLRLKIHRTKSTSQIGMIQILVLKAERLKYFCELSHCLTGTRSIGKFNCIKISWLQSDWKRAQNIHQILRTHFTQNDTRLANHLSQDLIGH